MCLANVEIELSNHETTKFLFFFVDIFSSNCSENLLFNFLHFIFAKLKIICIYVYLLFAYLLMLQ